jgi:hypothetical protein
MPTQRWRLIVARSADAPDLGQRELAAAWDAVLEAAGLKDPGAAEQPKLAFAAPIPLGLTADREPVDLFLPARRTAADVRTRVGTHLPAGYRLTELHDVWLGEPALPGIVVAGDYRVWVVVGSEPGGGHVPTPPGPGVLRTAVAHLLAAATVERSATRPGKPRTGNLRQLVDDVIAVSDAELWMRLRFDPVLGTGRPEEVVAALGDIAGRPLFAARRHRERLWLRGQHPTPGPEPGVPPGPAEPAAPVEPAVS